MDSKGQRTERQNLESASFESTSDAAGSDDRGCKRIREMKEYGHLLIIRAH